MTSKQDKENLGHSRVGNHLAHDHKSSLSKGSFQAQFDYLFTKQPEVAHSRTRKLQVD